MSVGRAGAALALVLGGACAPGESEGPVLLENGVAETVPDGWIPTLVAAPDRFEAAMAPGAREAWVSAHGGGWVAPGSGPQPGFVVAQARVEQTLASLELALLDGLVTTWSARGTLAADAPVLEVAWLAAASAGASVPAAVGALAPALAGPASLSALPAAASPAMRACVAAHAAARDAGELPPPGACAALCGTGLPDPLARRSRAAVLAGLAVADDPVAAHAFTSRWSTEVGAPTADALARWGPALVARGGPGLGLVQELQLVAGLQARAGAVALAEALPGLSPDAALARAQALVDASAGGRPGPTNPPLLLSLLALTRLRAGRTRPTLDALHAMRESWVDMGPLIELAGDHHVASGLGRDGDSKEL